MKKYKRLLSAALCGLMLTGSFGTAFAANIEEPQAELMSIDSTEDLSEALYLDFPFQVDNSIRKDMNMDLYFYYTKALSEADSVEIIITDTENNTVVLNEVLGVNDNAAALESVPNDKTYSVTVNEIINGTSAQYVKYIETKNVAADFPVDMTLGTNVIDNNNGEEFSHVKIKKVGENPVCNHGEDEACTDACSIFSVIDKILPENLNTFYSTLDSNAYYEMQVEATDNNVTELYQAFISTYTNGEDEGIFTRGYELRDTLNAPVITPEISTFSTRAALPDFTDAYEYEFYKNIYINNMTLGYEQLIKLIPNETGRYTIETIGNIDTVFEVYSSYQGATPSLLKTVGNGGVGNNASTTYEFYVDGSFDTVYYFLLMNEGDTTGPSAFRIVRTNLSGVGDDVTNYRDEVQANLNNNINSPANNESRYINYNGDIDIYGYKVSSGTGYAQIIPQGNTPSSGVTIEANILTADIEEPYDSTWSYDTITTAANNPKSYNFTSGRYYVDVKQPDGSLPAYGSISGGYFDEPSYKYDFKFYQPMEMDELDVAANHGVYGNDLPLYATEISSLPYSNNNLTLHKNDTDYFKFVAPENGGTVTVNVLKANNGVQYTPYLRSITTNSETNAYDYTITADNLGTYETSDTSKVLTYDGLVGGQTYYVAVNFDSTYSPMHTYSLNITVSEPTVVPDVYTATLSGNVNLAYTTGTTANIAAFKNTVMESLTCYTNNVAIDDTTAVNSVVLYYNNAELTAETVAGLTAGEYTVTVKYNGVEATGGTVTLTVSAPGVNVQLTGVTMVSVVNENWDWAACAKMIADVRLAREGSALSTNNVAQGIIAVKGTSNIGVRGSDLETANAANYFYTNGTLNTYNFYVSTIDSTNAENSLLSMLQSGQAVILKLDSVTNPTDISYSRYVLLTGINTGTQKYTIMDPFTGTTTEVGYDVLFEGANGGYNSNSDLRFTGVVIEFA